MSSSGDPPLPLLILVQQLLERGGEYYGRFLRDVEDASERGYRRAQERDRQLQHAQELLDLPALLTAKEAAAALGKIERGKPLGVPALDKRLREEEELPEGAPRPLTACRVGTGKGRRFDRDKLVAYAHRGPRGGGA